jgi:hypothetical protein
MLLEDLFYQFCLVLGAFIVLISIVIATGVFFQSTRSAMFSLVRWIFHGLRSLLPYVLPVVVGLGVGALSYDFLSFTSAVQLAH